MADIIDFTEHYMHRLIDQYAKKNDEQMAWALAETLDKYLMGEIGIFLIEGVPVPYIEKQLPVKKVDSPENKEEDDN
tara:strand:- start:313 stop:543 length:231 start_codon:yes stop_codon:yes gene_type:complete